MYHTQEQWPQRLTYPVICDRRDAWLGKGYYFWNLQQDARIWGRKSKTAIGTYEIYSADIDCADVLDTVFNEEEYNWWMEQIEKVAAALQLKSQGAPKPTKWQVYQYIREKRIWEAANITGILFEDHTENHERTRIADFHYKKRIQLVAFTLRIVNEFAFHSEQKCR